MTKNTLMVQNALQLPKRLFVYAVITVTRIHGEIMKVVKFGEHRCYSSEEATSYAIAETLGKLKGVINKEDVLVWDVTEHAQAHNPMLITSESRNYDDMIRPKLPGKHFVIFNDNGNSSQEVHQFHIDTPDAYIKAEFNKAMLEITTGVTTFLGKMYQARSYAAEGINKINAGIDKFLLGAAPGTGKEVTTITYLIHKHDLGYGTLFDKNTLHCATATIPSTAIEMLEELGGPEFVSTNTVNGVEYHFDRIVPYVTRSFMNSQRTNISNEAYYYISKKGKIVDSIDEIPAHNKHEVPVLFGSFPDIGLGENGKLKTRYGNLNARIGILSIGEGHQFLSKESNKIWSNVKQSLDYKFLLLITGTPYDFILNDYRELFFDNDHRVLFTKSEIFKDKSQHGDASQYQYHPWMNLYGLDFLEMALEEMRKSPKWAGEANLLTYKKLFNTKDKKGDLKYSSIICLVMKRILGEADQFTGDPDGLSIQTAEGLCEFAKRHLLVKIPAGDSHDIIPKLIKILVENNCLCGYTPYSAYDTDLSDLKKIIRDDAFKTIYFTCVKDLTGANIPGWGSYILLDSLGESIKFIEQSTSRPGRPLPGKDKHNYGVFLGDLGGILNITITVEEKLGIDKGLNKTHKEYVDTELANYNVFLNKNGKWSKAESFDVMELVKNAATRGEYELSMCLGDIQAPSEFDEKFKDVAAKVRTKLQLTSGEASGGKNKDRKDTGHQLDLFNLPAEAQRTEWWRNMIKRHLLRMRKMCYSNGYPNIKACANAIEEAVNNGNQKILDQIGNGFEWIEYYIDDQVDHQYTNRWISKAQECTTAKELLDIFGANSEHDKESGFVPESFELSEYILSEQFKHSNKSLEQVFIDPCGGNGIMIIVALLLSSKGIIDLDPKNVYYNDCDSTHVEFFRKINKQFNLGIPDSNIVCYDALGADFDKFIRNLKMKIKGMCVNIGTNPPFQLGKNKDFYISFVKKYNEIMTHGDTLGVIMPNRFVSTKSKSRKAFKGWLDVKAMMPNVQLFFKHVPTSIGAVIGTKSKSPNFNKDVPHIFFKEDNGVEMIDLPLNVSGPIVSGNLSSFSIVNKICNSKLPKMKINNGSPGNNYVFIRKTWVRYSPLKASGGPLTFSTLVSNDLGVPTDGDKVSFDTAELAELNNWFLNRSLLGRFLTHSFADFTFTGSSLVHSGNMPILPPGTEKSDDTIYKLFAITSTEIDYITEVITTYWEKAEEQKKANAEARKAKAEEKKAAVAAKKVKKNNVKKENK